MSVLITGTSGQVGGALAELFRQRQPETTVHAPSRAEMDLANPMSIRAYVARVRPRWIVSSAAYTAVDAAESDRDAAFAINATAPGVLAEEASRHGAALIHLSTDYVFPGTGERPWVETDATGPLNVYGASKLAGEQAIAATGAAHVILRTSWVYSAGGKNFVRTMLRLLSTRKDPLRIVADQYGGPTAAEDLATAILSIIEQTESQASGVRASEVLTEKTGIYHAAGSGETTWAGLAEAVRDYLEETMPVNPPAILAVPSSEYPTPAARPRNSRLDCGRLAYTFGITLPDWRKSLPGILEKLSAINLPEGRT